MIYNYPYFGLPNYNKYINSSKDINYCQPFLNPNLYPVNQCADYYKKQFYNQNNKTNKVCKNSNVSQEDIIEIFGIKFKFDDILIICILLFLFNENINDIYLILALIMLLLS